MEISGERVVVRGRQQVWEEPWHASSRRVELRVRRRRDRRLRSNDGLDDLGGQVYTVDSSDAEQVDGSNDRVESDADLDVIVNNSGTETTEVLDEMDPVVIERLIAIARTAPLVL